MHVLDIVQNSIKAGATLVQVEFLLNREDSLFTFRVEDNGCGMEPDFLARVTDPFTTTRTTRKVGLGIPMLKQSAEMTGGSLQIESEPGKGTTLEARLYVNHLDCIPMGEMCDSLFTLVVLNPEAPEFVFTARAGELQADFDTRQMRQVLGDTPLNEPDIAAWIRESIEEEFSPIFKLLEGENL